MDNAEYQKRYRDKKRNRIASNGGRVIQYEVYRETDNTIKGCCRLGGYEDEKEMLTILLRNVGKLPLSKRKKLLEL